MVYDGLPMQNHDFPLGSSHPHDLTFQVRLPFSNEMLRSSLSPGATKLLMEIETGRCEFIENCLGYWEYPLVNKHSYGTSPCYQWVNPLFQWSCSIAMLNYQRVYVLGYCKGIAESSQLWVFHGMQSFGNQANLFM